MRRRTTLLIWVINIIIIATVLVSTLVYVRKTRENSFKERQENYVKLADILQDIAGNYLRDEEALCESWNAAVSNRGYTSADVISFIREQNDGIYNVHVIWKDDYTGVSTVEKASAPGSYEVD